MKFLIAAVASLVVLLSGCCGPGCRPPRQAHYGSPRAYVHHAHPRRALFTEWQHPLIDPNGQYRLMGDAAFRDWQCQPPVKMEPIPE